MGSATDPLELSPRLDAGVRRPPWRPDVREVAAICAGGILGALARSALERSVRVAPGAWPWPTFAVNMAAALLLGALITLMQDRLPSSGYRRAFLGSGLCGALSTFSTVMVELLEMLEASRVGLAGAYAAATLAGGLALVFLSTKLVRLAGAVR